jgi:hypothetical protein
LSADLEYILTGAEEVETRTEVEVAHILMLHRERRRDTSGFFDDEVVGHIDEEYEVVRKAQGCRLLDR